MSIRVSGRGFAQPHMKEIYNVTLTAAGDFDITGIPPSHFALEVTTYLRSDIVAAIFDTVDMYINGDTTVANYRQGIHQVSGGSHTTTDSDALNIAAAPTDLSPANYFAYIRVYIPDYAGSNNKIYYVNFANRFDATTMLIGQYALQWENTAAINQITIQTDNDPTDEFVAGSQTIVNLYR